MPRSGKSTLLERIINEQQNKVGLLTKEIKEKDERIGVVIVIFIKATTYAAT